MKGEKWGHLPLFKGPQLQQTSGKEQMKKQEIIWRRPEFWSSPKNDGKRLFFLHILRIFIEASH